MSEPFDPLQALRTPIVAVQPDPEFATRLRARLVRVLLAPTPEETMTEHPTGVLLRDELSRNGTRRGDISYISLAVPDTARARTFYAAVLGWSYAPGQVEHESTQVDDVIPQVGLWPGPQPGGVRVHGAVLAFRVDDLATVAATVRERGGAASASRREPYGLTADCRDDQGLVFYLHELPPTGAPAPGNGVREGDISYISLLVTDTARARAFYDAVLGWRFSPGRSADGANVDGPTPMIGIAAARAQRPGAVLGYRVTDISTTVTRVRRAGGSATDPVQRPYARESDCVDDQGTLFYLHQFPG